MNSYDVKKDSEENSIAIEDKISGIFPSIVCIYDAEKRNFKYVDGNLKEILGYDHKELTLDSFLELVHEEDKEQVKNTFDSLKSAFKEDNLDFKCRLRHCDTTPRYFQTIGRVVKKGKNGQPSSFLLAARDITDVVEAERQKSEDRIQALERSNQALEEFAFIAAHDLKEPVRKIQTFIEKLEEKLPDQISSEAKDYFRRVISSTDKMNLLIDSLLQYSKAAQVIMLFEPTDLEEVVKEAMKEIEQEIQEANVKIEWDDLPTLELMPSQFKQVFIHLISNSIKFKKTNQDASISITTEKLSEHEVEKLRLARLHSWIRIIFRDNGIGFEREYADQIFKPFQKLNSSGEFPGPGMGLSLCKKIIENHKGLICADSEPGLGAIFSIVLPEKQKV